VKKNKNQFVGCGQEGEFPENRDGDTMCGSCHSDGEEEPEVIVLTVKRKKKN